MYEDIIVNMKPAPQEENFLIEIVNFSYGKQK